MIGRPALAALLPLRELRLRAPPNWTAVIFFAVLSALHFSVALPAFYHARWEGFLSLVLAIAFVLISAGGYLARCEMTVQPAQRRIHLRTGIGSVSFHRSIRFDDVHAIRLTQHRSRNNTESRIEILCDNEDIDCPATAVPRQQALLLALLMNAQLIRVSNDVLPDRREGLFC